jgi:hypothetical protein
MNNSEMMRIYKQLIPEKTEFIQKNNHTKNILLRLEEQRIKNTIQHFNSLSKKRNIDKNKYYSIFFNDKIFDIDSIKLLSIRLFHNSSLDEFIEIIYNNKYINDKIKQRISIFIVSNINKMMNKDKLNKFLITLYSDETRFKNLYSILKEIFFEKNNSDLFKFIMFLYKKHGISPFMDIFEFCYDQKDIEKFVRIFILTSGNTNTRYNNLMSFKNLLFDNIVSKLEKGYHKMLQMFLHEFDGEGNGKTKPILNYNPPHFKRFIPEIFERVKNLRNKLKNINKKTKSKMNEVNMNEVN